MEITRRLGDRPSTAGKFGHALNFYGSEGIAVGTSDTLSLTDAVTLSGWMKLSHQQAGVIALKGSPTEGHSYALLLTATQQVSASFKLGGVTQVITGPQPIPLNTWTYV